MQDEKKKVMVLGALALVVVGIGAFQMMPQDAPPIPPAKSKWKPPVDEVAEQSAPRNPVYVASLPRRNPFDLPNAAMPVEPMPSTPPPPARFLPRPPRRRMGGRLTGELPGDFTPLPVNDMAVEPVKPEGPSGPTEAAPVEPVKAPEPTFDYALNGVIVGRRSAAVLRDKQGNQRLIAAGGQIDGDATLVEVRPGAAIVNYRGKRLRIELKGDTDAK